MIAGEEASDNLAAARALYWRALVQLKVGCEYTQRYRDELDKRLTWFAVGRAIMSVTALGGWFAGVGQARLWGFIIVVSQVADAVLRVLPLTARARALRSFVAALDGALIDAQFEWEEQVNDDTALPADIRRRWHKLLRVQHEAETTYMASAGLPRKARLFKLAEDAAYAYILANYGVDRR